MAWLYAQTVGTPSGSQWRLRGHTPSPSEFAAFVWAESPLQLVVAKAQSAEPVAVAQLYGVSWRGGTGKAAFFVVPEAQRLGWAFEGLLIFLDHCFLMLKLRKLYFEIPQYNMQAVGNSLSRFLELEAKLSGHEYANGRYHDLMIYSLDRDAWHALLSAQPVDSRPLQE